MEDVKKGKKKVYRSKDEGEELPKAKVTGLCRACKKEMFRNRFFHSECLDNLDASQINDDSIYF